MLRTRRDVLQAEVAELSRQLGYVDALGVAFEYGVLVRRKLILAGALNQRRGCPGDRSRSYREAAHVQRNQVSSTHQRRYPCV
jgi:hypothetical protein